MGYVLGATLVVFLLLPLVLAFDNWAGYRHERMVWLLSLGASGPQEAPRGVSLLFFVACLGAVAFVLESVEHGKETPASPLGLVLTLSWLLAVGVPDTGCSPCSSRAGRRTCARAAARCGSTPPSSRR